jgi:hypothetical protein
VADFLVLGAEAIDAEAFRDTNTALDFVRKGGFADASEGPLMAA